MDIDNLIDAMIGTIAGDTKRATMITANEVITLIYYLNEDNINYLISSERYKDFSKCVSGQAFYDYYAPRRIYGLMFTDEERDPIGELRLTLLSKIINQRIVEGTKRAKERLIEYLNQIMNTNSRENYYALSEDKMTEIKNILANNIEAYRDFLNEN